MHEKDWDKHIITVRFSEEEQDKKIKLTNTINTIRNQLNEKMKEQDTSILDRE